MQVKTIAECSKGSTLQYSRPSLSYHLSLRSFVLSIFEYPFGICVHCLIHLSVYGTETISSDKRSIDISDTFYLLYFVKKMFENDMT